jgi:hypothetical protein
MQDFIDWFLSECRSVLKNEVGKYQRMKNIDCLRDEPICFSPDQGPRYNLLIHQIMYLLQYFYDYFLEYKTIFDLIKTMKAELELTIPLEVFSLGCGAGLDCYGMFFAGFRNDSTKYFGVDLENWFLSPAYWNKNFVNYGLNEEFFKNNIRIEKRSIVDCKKFGIDLEDYNVFIIPKSHTDISEQDFSTFCNNVDRADFSRRKNIIVVSSYVVNANDNNIGNGQSIPFKQQQKHKELYSKFTGKGFVEIKRIKTGNHDEIVQNAIKENFDNNSYTEYKKLKWIQYQICETHFGKTPNNDQNCIGRGCHRPVHIMNGGRHVCFEISILSKP